MPELVTYTCAVCGMRFGDADAATAARERDLHEQLDHNYTAPTEAEKIAERESVMSLAGFPRGSRVRMRMDGHPGLPAHVRPLAGDEGEVVLNLAVPADRVCVRFAGKMHHALAPADVERI